MASRQSFQLQGLDKLKATMEALGPELATKAGQTATRAAANVIRDAAREAAPVGDDDTSRTYTVNGGTETRTADYGHLRDNIKTRKGKPRKAHTVVSFVTTGSAFWGRLLEFGTEKMAARPWLKPATDSAASAALAAMTKTLEKALDRAVKKVRRS